MIESFAKTLKAFRRNVHVHQGEWRAVVICRTAAIMQAAWDEANAILNGTSFSGQMKASLAKRTVDFDNGAQLRFSVANSFDEIDLRLRGLEITHVIFVGMDDEPDLPTYAQRFMRSQTVPPEAYKVHVTRL